MTIKDLQLYKENNQYYLSAVFNFEDKKGYYELSVPKIALPISNCQVNHTSYSDTWEGRANTTTVDFGFCELSALPCDAYGTTFILHTLEEKVRPMTLAEIEKELGYKIALKEEEL